MKKLLLLLLVSISAANVFAARAPLPREDYVTQIESCEAIIQEFMLRPDTAIPAEILAQARAIVITNQFKAGFILGVKDGYGILMIKKPDGRWSVPVFLNAGEASIGFQIGATTVETVYVIMDDETPRRLYGQRFNIGADVRAIAGPRIAERDAQNRAIIAAPVLVYTKSNGIYAGATVKAGTLSRNEIANRAFYNTTHTMPEILYSDWITPPAEVVPLMNYMQRISP